MRFISISGSRLLYIGFRCCRLRTAFEPICTPISGRYQPDFERMCTPLSGRRKTLGDRCSPDIADVDQASISISSSYSYRYRADIVPIYGRHRAEIGPTSDQWVLLSGLLNDFESKKENLSCENYMYDQEYFDTFNIFDQKHIVIYLNNLYCFN